MDANTKHCFKVTGGFLLKIVAYTACVTAIHFIINDGAEYPKSQKTVLFFLLCYGYYNAYRWLARKLRQLKTKSPNNQMISNKTKKNISPHIGRIEHASAVETPSVWPTVTPNGGNSHRLRR